MWLSTHKIFDSTLMFFQFQRKGNFCIFEFTNMKQLYSKTIHESLLASTYSSTNNLIELEVADVLKFFENIKESDNIIYNFYPDKTNIKTDIIVTLTEGFPPFKLELELELTDANDFYINLTYPLLKIIQLLKKNQEALCNLLQKKDLEIAEYVLERGSNIEHKNICTESFDKDNFLMNTFEKYKNACDENFNLYDIYSSSLIEPIDNRCIDEQEKLKNKSNEAENTDMQKKSSKKKYMDFKGSPATEITQTSINNIKKKKISLLKNL